MIWLWNIRKISWPGAQNFAVCLCNTERDAFEFSVFFIPVGKKIGAVLKGPAWKSGTNFEYSVDAFFFSFSPARTSRRRGRNLRMGIYTFIIMYLIEPLQTTPLW